MCNTYKIVASQFVVLLCEIHFSLVSVISLSLIFRRKSITLVSYPRLRYCIILGIESRRFYPEIGIISWSCTIKCTYFVLRYCLFGANILLLQYNSPIIVCLVIFQIYVLKLFIGKYLSKIRQK